MLETRAALNPSYRSDGGSAKAESDAFSFLTAESLMGATDDPPAKLAVEADRPFVVRQRPDDDSGVAVTRQILARRLEHAPPEAAALAFRREIELEDLPAIAERRHPVAPVAHIADDRIGELEHQKRRATHDRHAPPGGASARDHPFELAPGNHAAIGFAPSGVVHRRDVFFISRPRRANGNDRLDHGRMLRPGAVRLQGLDNGTRGLFCWAWFAFESAHWRRNFCVNGHPFLESELSKSMSPRFSWAPLLSAAIAAALGSAPGARADVLHATYRVSLIGFPIGAANLDADLSPTSYSIKADAKLTG